MIFNYIWFWRSRLPERKGQSCRVVARGSMNTVLVEFIDGYRVFTSRWAVRRNLNIKIDSLNLRESERV